MIFTALGLLVAAAGFLIAGIAKSSVALLMVSLVVTLAATAVLVMAFGAARRIAGAGVIGPAGAPVMAMPALPAMNGAGGQPTMVMYVPVQQAVPAANGGVGSAPVVGYDAMSAEQVTRLVASGALGPDQLSALREYEAAHAKRRTVLNRLDKALA